MADGRGRFVRRMKPVERRLHRPAHRSNRYIDPDIGCAEPNAGLEPYQLVAI